MANVTASVLMITGKIEVAPFLSLSEAHLSTPHFSESGAGAADLQIGALDTDTVNQKLGASVQGQFESRYGRIAPSIKVAWSHDYTDGPIPISGDLAGQTFANTSSRPNPNGAYVGVAVVLERSRALKVGLEYDGEVRRASRAIAGR